MCKWKKTGSWQNREFGKIGSYAQSRISQNREAPIRILDNYSCGAKKNYLHHAIYCCNLSKWGISQNREPPIRILMGCSTTTVAVLKKLPPTCYILLYKCANVKNREFVKIGNFVKSGIFQNREASSGEIDHYTCGAKKGLPPTCYILLYKCANEKKTGSWQNREYGKIGNLAKSGIIQNRKFCKIVNLSKSGIWQNREASSGEIDHYSCCAKKNCL